MLQAGCGDFHKHLGFNHGESVCSQQNIIGENRLRTPRQPEMSTKATATIRLNFTSEKQLDTLLNALMPEAQAPQTHRAAIKLQKDGTNLTLTVDAEDTVALRATLNAYLHWINSTIKVIEVVETTAKNPDDNLPNINR
jgi:tRNA threonylcarbamoyladenosine modification (KEOPS) complex  Pcc1 subunit